MVMTAHLPSSRTSREHVQALSSGVVGQQGNAEHAHLPLEDLQSTSHFRVTTGPKKAFIRLNRTSRSLTQVCVLASACSGAGGFMTRLMGRYVMKERRHVEPVICSLSI